MEYETPHWAGGVYAVRKTFEVDAALPEFVDQKYQVPVGGSPTFFVALLPKPTFIHPHRQSWPALLL